MSQVGICDVKSCEKLEKNRTDLKQVNINNITYDLCKVCYDGLIGFIAGHLNQGKPLVDKPSFDMAKHFETSGFATSTSPYVLQQEPKWTLNLPPTLKIVSATDTAYPMEQEIKFTDEK